MNKKEALMQAVKESLLYIAAFVALLILAPLFRGEPIDKVWLRVGVLLLGCVIVINLRYQQIKLQYRNEELRRRSEEAAAKNAEALPAEESEQESQEDE